MTNSGISGANIIGGNPRYGRVENDFYVTDPKAVTMLLENHLFPHERVLEPCVGNGTIANEIIRFYQGQVDMTAVDLIDRGYPNTIVHDFLTWETDKQFDGIITNPPYSLASEFIDRSLSLLRPHGELAMFLKIQFLEGAKRTKMFTETPPRYVYVFRNRMATWSEGRPVNPETGKKWATTMCNAWYVWEKDCKKEPIIRWL